MEETPRVGEIYPGEGCEVVYFGQDQIPEALREATPNRLWEGVGLPHVVLMTEIDPSYGRLFSVWGFETSPRVVDKSMKQGGGFFTRSNYVQVKHEEDRIYEGLRRVLEGLKKVQTA